MFVLITARCYAERGAATASRSSVRPSVSLSLCDYEMSITYVAILSRMIGLSVRLSADPNNANLLQSIYSRNCSRNR